jgi:glycosyltransferase involved in cell wall biosynthesis
MAETRIDISIVSPLYNEGGNVRHLVERIVAAMRALNEDFEIVLVDDGSSDNTWDQICAAATETTEVIGVRLSRNFGHQGALLAGLHRARGQAVITMDGDLQHPPEYLSELIASWRDGAEIVLTRRIEKENVSAFKRLTSGYFYRLFSFIAEAEIEPRSSDFRLMDRQALDQLLRLRFGQLFLRGAVQTLGFRKSTVTYEIGERYSGTTKYTLAKMLRFARHGLISHSSFPLRFSIYLGGLTGFLSVLELTYVVVQAFRGETVAGWASTLGLMSLLFSVLFVILGIVGLYLEDIHRLLKHQPHFIVAEGVGHAEVILPL